MRPVDELRDRLHAARRRAEIAGARADVLALDAPNHLHLAYRPGVPLVAGVWKDGQTVVPLHEEDI